MNGVPPDAYSAAREGAIFARLEGIGALSVGGAQRLEFLHGLLSSDVRALAVGAGQASCLLTPKGRVIADLHLYRRDQDLLAVCSAGALPALLRTLGHMSALSEVSLEDLSARTAFFFVGGPRADAVLESVAGTGAGRSPLAGEGAATACRAAETPAGPAWALDYPALGSGGRLLLADSARAGELDRALAGTEAVPAGAQTLELLRIEAGAPRAGSEYEADAFPQELNLEGALSFEKGCYLGQETIAHIRNRGHVNRRLVGLLLPAGAAPGDALVHAGEPVGRITSAADSPGPEGRRGLGIVRAALALPGARLEVAARGGTLAAEIVELPA